MQIVAFTAVWGCNDMTRLGCLKRGKWPGSRLSYVRRTVEHRPVDCGCTHADRLRITTASRRHGGWGFEPEDFTSAEGVPPRHLTGNFYLAPE